MEPEDYQDREATPLVYTEKSQKLLNVSMDAVQAPLTPENHLIVGLLTETNNLLNELCDVMAEMHSRVFWIESKMPESEQDGSPKHTYSKEGFTIFDGDEQ